MLFKQFSSFFYRFREKIIAFSLLFFCGFVAFVLLIYNQGVYPTYGLEVEADNVENLNSHLPTDGVFLLEENRVWVPAIFTMPDGSEYDVEVRYRGLMGSHWKHDKKSYAVKFKSKSGFPLGRQKINFIVPSDKGFMFEPLNYLRAQYFGLKTMDSRFVKLKINNNSSKVYWMTGKFDKAFLGNHNLSDSIDLYTDSFQIYGDKSKLTTNQYIGLDSLFAHLFNSVTYFDKEVSFDYFPRDDYSNLYYALSLIRDNSTTSKDLFLLFDRENLLAMNAMYKLVGSSHFRNNLNWVLYFDPSIGKFYFVPWDIHDDLEANHEVFAKNHYRYNGFLMNILFYKLGLDSDFEADVDTLVYKYGDEQMQSDYNSFDKIYKDFYMNYVFEKDKILTGEAVPITNEEFKELVHRQLEFDKGIATFATDPDKTYQSVFPPITKDNFTQYYPYVEFLNGQYVIRNDAFIDRNFFIPKGFEVVVYPGVTLSIAADVNFIIYGKLNFLGQVNKRIVLQPADENLSWGTVLYMNPSSSGSKVEYVDFIRAGDALIGFLPNLHITSPLASLFTDIYVKGVRFENVVYDNYTLTHRRNINIIQHVGIDDFVKSVGISPDTFDPIRIVSMQIDGSYGDIISPDGQRISLEDISRKIFVPRPLTQYTDLDDWYVGQEVPWEYIFTFTDSKIKNIEIQFEKVDMDAVAKYNLRNIDDEHNVKSVFVYDDVFQNVYRRNIKMDTFLEQYNNIFELTGANELTLRRGTYRILEDIIIPEGLRVVIEPGVYLEMAPQVSILSYSPVIAVGNSEEHISIRGMDHDYFNSLDLVLESSGKVESVDDNLLLREDVDVLVKDALNEYSSKRVIWGAFGVVGKHDERSQFSYIDFEGGSEDYLNGVYLSGMFSVYHNGAAVEHSSFKYAHADDALNFKYSDGYVKNSVFQNNSADAIDFDFMGGSIEYNSFIDNGNDSIDFSGSTTDVYDNNVKGSGDKCISIGEGSEVYVIQNVLEGCRVGIEVKDGSVVTVDNSVIEKNNIGVNMYVKKYYFPSPLLYIRNSNLEKNDVSSYVKDGSRIYAQ